MVNENMLAIVGRTLRKKRFNAKETQTLIINGYIVAGDRRSAKAPDGKKIYPKW
jgi:hypothetical protein